MAMLTPVILATFFTLFQWWRIEENWSNRLKTLPFVILLCWPQYRVVKILYFGLWKQVSKWKTENNILKKEIGHIGTVELILTLVRILLEY